MRIDDPYKDPLGKDRKRWRVWHIPQVPGKSFAVECRTVQEAELILDVLAEYDYFQLEERIKGDYSNAGGIICYVNDELGWEDYDSEDEEQKKERMKIYD